MILPLEAIEEFRDLYRQQFAIELTEEEAKELAEMTFAAFRVAYKPIPLESTKEGQY